MRKPLVVLLVLALFAPLAIAKEPPPELMRLRAFAINRKNRARTGQVDIIIERWTTPEESEAIKTVFVDRLSKKLVPELQKMKPRCGYVRDSNMNTWDLYYARLIPMEHAGQKIVLATDRPVNRWEVRHSTRVGEYEFSLAEIHLGPDGKGEGKAIPAAKLNINPSTGLLEIENYQAEPVKLNEVRIIVPKNK